MLKILKYYRKSSLYLKPSLENFSVKAPHQQKSFIMDNTMVGQKLLSGSIMSLNSYFHLTPEELYIEDITP